MDETQGSTRGTSAPEHHAPPPYRPLSALAVSAAVVAVLLGFLAMSGLWWLAAPGLILGTLAWSLLAAGRKRGRGLALAAAVGSLVVGVWSFASARAVADSLERALAPFVRALAAPSLEEGARVELDRWVGPTAGPYALEGWRSRFEAAGVGRSLERLEIGSVWLGPLATLIAVPRDVAEVAPSGAPVPEPGDAVWIRAHFGGGQVWLALVPEGEPKGHREATERMTAFFQALADGRERARLRDVRVFRPVD